MKKDPNKIERAILVVVALIISPMLLYTAHLTKLSLKEGETYRNARLIEPDSGVPKTPVEEGTFCQVQGAVTGGLLNPAAFPEITSALQTQITREVFDTEAQQWKPADKKPDWSQATQIEVGGLPVKISVASRIMIDPVSLTLHRAEGERFVVRTHNVLHEDYVVYGMYVGGALQDGHHERLIIAPLKESAQVLALIERAGKKKAMILAILSGVFAILIGLTLKAAFATRTRTV